MIQDRDITKLVGLPFVAGGVNPLPVELGGDGGVDCWGLVVHAAGFFGMTLPANPALLDIGDTFDEVDPRATVNAGDIVEMVIRGEERRPHVGIVVTRENSPRGALVAHAVAAGTSRIDRLGALRAAGLVTHVWRCKSPMQQTAKGPDPEGT